MTPRIRHLITGRRARTFVTVTALVTGIVTELGGADARAGIAASTPSAVVDARSGVVMNIPLNKSQTLRLDRPFAKAVIGNDDIADCMPTSVSSIYVQGKAIGSTNLTILDRKGALVAVIDVVVGPDAEGLKRQLADLLPHERIGVTVSNDALVLDGHVSSAGAAERAATVAETYAPKKVANLLTVDEPQQVLLEVRFAEMTRGTVKQLGINNFNFFNASPIPIPVTAGQAASVPTAAFGGVPPTAVPYGVANGSASVPAINPAANPYAIKVGLLGSGVSFEIDALEQQGLIHTLAQPNLVALSGESASFLAGGEFPVPTGVDAFGRLSIEFKQFGVSLAFVPTVVGDGLINLSVAPEVSSLDQTAGIQLSGVTIPGLKVRRAKTALELRDGEAFAMAGLIQSDFNDTVKAIPLLGKIPIIGALFRSTYFNRNETELVIVVTPHIVRPVRPDQIALPTERVRQPSDVDILLNGKSERRGPPPKLPADVKPGGIDADIGHVLK
ncbi:MAG: type II and III secretion system protein family protein [Sphingomonadaceae bacterium]|nr:type II and III secretion system protein family protein [Sphingomonadaceae bacterium]